MKVLGLFLLSALASATGLPELHDGDLIFQSSRSSQSQAIQLATHSRYSHVGLIFKDGDQWMVYEAVQPAKKTRLTNWIQRGDGGAFVLKRLKDTAPLSGDGAQRLKAAAKVFLGKDYDWAFGWSDDKVYCSELVWKAYKNGLHLTLSPPKKLKDFDLDPAPVKAKLKERYGDKVPLDEPVVSPADLYASPLLVNAGHGELH
jgi:hypothetical protein